MQWLYASCLLWVQRRRNQKLQMGDPLALEGMPVSFGQAKCFQTFITAGGLTAFIGVRGATLRSVNTPT